MENTSFYNEVKRINLSLSKIKYCPLMPTSFSSICETFVFVELPRKPYTKQGIPEEIRRESLIFTTRLEGVNINLSGPDAFKKGCIRP